MIETLLNDPSYWGTAVGLTLFLGLFIATVLWMYRPGAREKYLHTASLPFDDDAKPIRRRK